MNRKFTFKIVTIIVLVLALLIPLTMITDVISERTMYRNEAKDSIAQSWTGRQQFLGPVLVVPYVERYTKKEWDSNLKVYKQNAYFRHKKVFVLPETLNINGDISTQQRARGLYTIPVYSSAMNVNGMFSNAELVQLDKRMGKNVTWKHPYLAMYVSDIRGISEQPRLAWDKTEFVFASGPEVEGWENGMHVNLPLLTLQKEKQYAFSFKVALKGMEGLQFAPVGKTTEVYIKANWPNPSFIGRYLPTTRRIDDQSFTASWKVSSFSSGMPGLMKECEKGSCYEFTNHAFGVDLINTVDIYQQTERSVKYAYLFITLTFVVFFLFEIMKNLRLHPMQYLLVGLSLSFFYLLLISLSEHMAFAGAYAVSAVANVLIIGVYISEVLKGRMRALGFSALLTLLYVMLYFILISEDNALLMGSLLLFGVLSLVMFITRKLDWYQVTERLADRAVLDQPLQEQS